MGMEFFIGQPEKENTRIHIPGAVCNSTMNRNKVQEHHRTKHPYPKLDQAAVLLDI
jgi:hypothetical protein